MRNYYPEFRVVFDENAARPYNFSTEIAVPVHRYEDLIELYALQLLQTPGVETVRKEHAIRTVPPDIHHRGVQRIEYVERGMTLCVSGSGTVPPAPEGFAISNKSGLLGAYQVIYRETTDLKHFCRDRSSGESWGHDPYLKPREWAAGELPAYMDLLGEDDGYGWTAGHVYCRDELIRDQRILNNSQAHSMAMSVEMAHQRKVRPRARNKPAERHNPTDYPTDEVPDA